MDTGEIELRLRTELNREFEIDENLIRHDAHIMDTLGLDSLDMVDLVVLIDQSFGIKLTKEEVVGADTFGKLVDLISSKS